MEPKGFIVLLLAFCVTKGQSPDCPCSVQSGVFTCRENSIQNIPEDLNIEECALDLSGVNETNIENQTLSHIKDNAFSDFPAVSILSLSFNQIEVIEKNAFIGLTGLSMLFLKANNLTKMEGIFDPLVNLNSLDLRENDYIESYTTHQWQFCNIADKKDLIRENIRVFKEFETSSETENYCKSIEAFHIEGCNKVGEDLYCTAIDDLMHHDAPCYLEYQTFTNIFFSFPADKYPSKVEDYGRGASDAFFEEFNSQKGENSHYPYMSEITLYEIKFDLAEMKSYTSSRTTMVTIKADTIYMSAPVEISHKLNLIGRVVSLAHPITMKMTKEMFFESNEIEAWAEKEEYYNVGKVVMTKKAYGLVTILKNKIDEPLSAKKSTSICQPNVVSVEETNINIEAWYDATLINLLFVCAKTVLESKINPSLVEDISTFTLGFVYNRTIVNNQETFIAAQKYKKLNSTGSKVHNVPPYSEGTSSGLTSIMYSSMTDYKQNEMAQEEQLFIASGRVNDIEVHFDMVGQQQKYYFEKEKAVLELIWAAEDNEWNFNFEHRNEIEDNVGGAMNDINDQMDDINELDLVIVKEEAEASLLHIETVIKKYESHVGQYLLLNQKFSDGKKWKNIVENLQHCSGNMVIEFQIFETMIEDWKHVQEVRELSDLFNAILIFGFGLTAGHQPPEAIEDIIDNNPQIEDLLLELLDIIENSYDIHNIMNDFDFNNINLNLDTNLKDALHHAIDLKGKSGSFDEIERTATIKLDAMNAATNYEIDANDIMMASVALLDSCHQLVNLIPDFVENVLMLSERKNFLAIARANKDRTIAEIEHIQQMLKDLQNQKVLFEAGRDRARIEYENELKVMEFYYVDITQELREEYRKNITALYDDFQSVFIQQFNGFIHQTYLLMNGIQQKFFGLKIHSMNQRAMVMSVFVDYCEADFYNTFETCDQHIVLPYLSDQFDTLLHKLVQLDWNAVTSPNNLPGMPIKFSGQLWRDSSYIIESLKNLKMVDINLNDLDNFFDDFWRVRIDSLSLILLDADGYPIQSCGTTFGCEISIKIRFPTIFSDVDYYGEEQSFLALSFSCHSDYYTEGEGISHINFYFLAILY